MLLLGNITEKAIVRAEDGILKVVSASGTGIEAIPIARFHPKNFGEINLVLQKISAQKPFVYFDAFIIDGKHRLLRGIYDQIQLCLVSELNQIIHWDDRAHKATKRNELVSDIVITKYSLEQESCLVITTEASIFTVHASGIFSCDYFS